MNAVIFANGRYTLMYSYIALKMKWEIHYSGSVEDCIKFIERENNKLKL